MTFNIRSSLALTAASSNSGVMACEIMFEGVVMGEIVVW